MNYLNIYKSPLGNIYLRSDGLNLTGLWFEKQLSLPKNILSLPKKDLALFTLTTKYLNLYFSKHSNLPNIPLKLSVTPFQEKVYELLLQIPYGETLTYKELAKLYAKKYHLPSMSAQAIGNAVSKNPISIIIPCHRIIGANNNLTGYSGGLTRKLALLELEGQDKNKYKM